MDYKIIENEPVGAGVPDRPTGEDYPSVACGDTSPDKGRQEEMTQPYGEPVGDDAHIVPQEESPRHGDAVPPPFRQGGQDIPTQPECEPNRQETRPRWYIDLTREEFVSFRMLLARVNGPLKMRIPTLIMSLICFATVVAMAVEDWYLAGFEGIPDPVLLVGALLVLLPGLYLWFYLPIKLKKEAAAQYDRSEQAGMGFCGELNVGEGYVEKASPAAVGHIRMDERALFIETADMMVFAAAGSPAVVIPARCLDETMAAAVHAAADRLPVRNRKFIARTVPQGQVITCPPPAVKPEELFVTTFTYTAEEYATVMRGLILQHFWRVAPMTAITATGGALLFAWGEEWWMAVVDFLVIAGVLTLLNLILPLARVKGQAAALSPHERTVQVRMDTIALRVKGQTTAENYALWCDVDHVYEREDFVEIVHNKHASLYIPKRVIDDLDAFDTVIKRCRGEQ